MKAVAPPIGGTWSRVAVAAGATCGTTNTGRLFCWGRGGLLANGSTTSNSSPQLVFSSGAGLLAGGKSNFCAVQSSTDLYCWGIGVAAGNYYATMPMKALGLEGAIRASLLHYTSREDLERLLKALDPD